MKKLMLAIVIFICVTAYSEGWNNYVNMLFRLSEDSKVSSHADRNGIHVVYSDSGGIKYALMSSAGSVIRSGIVIESINSGCDYPSVECIDDVIYAIYKKNDSLRISKSTNLGQNWTTDFGKYALINTGMNSLSTEVNGDAIHIVWSELRLNDNYYYDVHYVLFNTDNHEFSSYKRVTDDDTEGGQKPSIAFSSYKIHIGYLGVNASADWTKSRDKIISTDTWENILLIPMHYAGFVNIAKEQKVLTSGNYLHMIYRMYYSSWGGGGQLIRHSYRGYTDTIWTIDSMSNNHLYLDTYSPIFLITKTNDEKIHTIYQDTLGYAKYKTLSELTTWSDNLSAPYVVGLLPYVALSSNSNDLYIVKNPERSGYLGQLEYQQYDAAPLIPSNFSVSSTNGLPVLSWTCNSEPDVYNNSSAYIIQKRTCTDGSGNYTSWQNLVTLNGSVSTYTDSSITSAGSGPKLAQYKIKANDFQSNSSEYSNSVSIHYGNYLEKMNLGNDYDYSLSQNYPNPFNSTTIIKYKIPTSPYTSHLNKGEDGRGSVTLKIYDILGRDVETLVNEEQSPGIYNVEWNASRYTSGIYYYELTVGNGSEPLRKIKKMIYVK